MPTLPDPDALLVALALAPGTFSRNKFFEMYQERVLHTTRRRAQMVRSLIRELTEPWPHPGELPTHPAPVIEEQVERGGSFHLSYRVDEFDYRRSAVLTPIEAAAFRYALHRAGCGELSETDRTLVEMCLTKMNPL